MAAPDQKSVEAARAQRLRVGAPGPGPGARLGARPAPERGARPGLRRRVGGGQKPGSRLIPPKPSESLPKKTGPAQ